MTKPDRDVITELEAVLTSQEYSPVVVRNYCAYARGFLGHPLAAAYAWRALAAAHGLGPVDLAADGPGPAPGADVAV